MPEYSVDYINSAVKSDPTGFAGECSRDYLDKADSLAEKLLSRKTKIMMLAGPSSSGKTTTASILAKSIIKKGAAAFTVSLDDFYLASQADYPVDENGEPDYETVDALDLNLAGECFLRLMNEGKSELPIFDFDSHSRSEETRSIDLGKDGILIVEGLHALNPAITEKLPDEHMYKVYVSVSSRVKDDDKIISSKRDLRLVRRMVRDEQFRSTPAEETLEMWHKVMAGENNYLFPFEKYADKKLDSFHLCEPGLLAGKALNALDDCETEKAEQLKDMLSRFEPISENTLPGDSLLREFLG